jgi:DNA helicase II / ATP-dependent DNA helicase PcrA
VSRSGWWSQTESNAPTFESQLKFVKRAAKAYRFAKTERNYVDFDDLLVGAGELLTAHQELRRKVMATYDYVMVDEFQDTNRIQARLIELVGGLDDPISTKNVMVVTDPGQSMYRFRGAWYGNTGSFISLWNPTIFPLSVNYRSTQEILDLANQIDRTFINGHRRRLKAAELDPTAPMPGFIEFARSSDEAKVVANTILLHKENGTPLKDQAILVRSIWQGRVLETELIARRIPYKVYGGRQIIEAAHIKDVLAVLRVAENQKDSLALKRVLELIRGIGPAASKEIAQAIIDDNCGSFTAALISALVKRTSLADEVAAVFSAALKRKVNLVDRVKLICKRMRPILKQCRKYVEDIDDRLKDLAVLPTIARNFTTAREILGGPDA